MSASPGMAGLANPQEQRVVGPAVAVEVGLHDLISPALHPAWLDEDLVYS